jgi:hypothetical protein
MSERSSRRELVACALLVLVGCSKEGDSAPAGKKKPLGDPAAVKKIAEVMKKTDPPPAASRECKPEDYAGVMTMTFPSMFKLSGETKVYRDGHENADWVNPYDLDHASVRTLLDASADAAAKGEAAGEFLAAQSYLIYRIDLVDVGLAFAFKDIKRGLVAARGIKYDKSGRLVCITTYTFTPSKKVSEWAMDEAEKGGVKVKDIVVEKLREDLRVRYLRKIIQLGMPLPPSPDAPRAGAADDEG